MAVPCLAIAFNRGGRLVLTVVTATIILIEPSEMFEHVDLFLAFMPHIVFAITKEGFTLQ